MEINPQKATQAMMIGAGKGSPLYLSDGKPMTLWNFPGKAAGPSSTSMSLLSVTMAELLWPRLWACASSRLSSFVAAEDTHTDLGADRELRAVR